MLALMVAHFEVVGHVQILVVVRIVEFVSEDGSGQLKKMSRLAEVVSVPKNTALLIRGAVSVSAKAVSGVQNWVQRMVIHKGGKSHQREKMGSGRSELWLRNSVA